MIKCTFENDSSTSLRHVTVDGIILDKNNVLLNQRGSFAGKPILESGKWGLIGGYVERNETIAQAFAREAFEETGCKLDNIRLLRIKDNPDRPKEDRQNISFVMVADLVSMTKVTTEEVKKLQWFDLENLPAMSEMAFDHGQDLLIFKDYLAQTNWKTKVRFPAPII